MTDSGLFVKILEVRRKRLPKDVSLPCITGPYSEDYSFGLYGSPNGKIAPSQVIDLLKDKQEGTVDFQGATWKKYPNKGISKLKLLTVRDRYPITVVGTSSQPTSLEALAQYLRESNNPFIVLLKNENDICCYIDGKITSASTIMPDKSLYQDLSKFVNDFGGVVTAYLTQDTHFYEKTIETRDEVEKFLDDHFAKLSHHARFKNISFIGDLLPVLLSMDNYDGAKYKYDEAKCKKEIKYLQKCASEKNIENVNTSIVVEQDTDGAFLVPFEIPETDCKLSYEVLTQRSAGRRTLNMLLECSHYTYEDGASERPESTLFPLGTVKCQRIG
ncbi:MAG: hypothetical protein Q7J54_06290 [Candidatus Woesearchaeota archaeon]|nr:hypothetical protein [Candidatus Woesearchaeota archaeon]